MTPQEKAKELVEKFLTIKCYNTRPIELSISQAKQCSLIAVDEILKESSNDTIHLYRNGVSDNEYWQQVKQEIINYNLFNNQNK